MTVDAADVDKMTPAEQRQLLADLWTKKPPVPPTPAGAQTTAATQRPAGPVGGPGTEMKAMLAELGVGSDLVAAVCGGGCDTYAAQMDRWSVAGCSTRLHEIAGRLKDQAIAHKAQFRDNPIRWAKIAARALKMGLILNPFNPYPGLVQLAIERAEAKAAAEPTKPAAGTPGPSPEGSSPSLG